MQALRARQRSAATCSGERALKGLRTLAETQPPTRRDRGEKKGKKMNATQDISSGLLCDDFLREAASAAGITINETLERHQARGGDNPFATMQIDGVEWIYWPGFGWRKSHNGR